MNLASADHMSSFAMGGQHTDGVAALPLGCSMLCWRSCHVVEAYVAATATGPLSGLARPQFPLTPIAISPSFLPRMVVVLGRCFCAKAIHDIVSLFTKVALMDVVSLLDVFVVCRQKLSVDLR